MVIDMAEVGFIDSSGLNRILVALRRQRDHGGDVELRSPQPHARRVLEILGVDKYFPIA